jgi:hypothetical protein
VTTTLTPISLLRVPLARPPGGEQAHNARRPLASPRAGALSGDV